MVTTLYTVHCTTLYLVVALPPNPPLAPIHCTTLYLVVALKEVYFRVLTLP